MQVALYRHQIDVEVACTMLHASVCKKKMHLGTDKCIIIISTDYAKQRYGDTERIITFNNTGVMYLPVNH